MSELFSISNDSDPDYRKEMTSEELNRTRLQWDICLLHLNELPLRHIFMKIDGTIKGPDKFSGAIGSQLNGNVSKWGVAKLRSIPNLEFVILDNEVIDDLSTDQYYAYLIFILFRCNRRKHR